MNKRNSIGNKVIFAVFAAAVALMYLILPSRKNAPVSDVTPDSTPVSRPAIDISSETASPAFQAAAARRRAHAQQTLDDDRLAKLADAILRRLQSTDQAAHDEVFTNLLASFISLDPAFAARFAESLGPEAGREDVLRRVAQAWGVADPEAALAWAEHLSNAVERESALTAATMQLAQSDPARAIELAEQHGLKDDSGFVGALAGLWGERDLTAALAWAGRQPAGDQKNEIIARLAYVESQTSPLEAANRVVRDIPPGTAQEEAVMSVLNQWANRDIAAAAAWVDRFPDGAFRERARAELAGLLSRSSTSGSTAPN